MPSCSVGHPFISLSFFGALRGFIPRSLIDKHITQYRSRARARFCFYLRVTRFCRVTRGRIIREHTRERALSVRDISKLNQISRNILHLSCASPLYSHISPPFERGVIAFLMRVHCAKQHCILTSSRGLSSRDVPFLRDV